MVNCISNDSSSAPTDPTCIAVPSTSDEHVFINTCTAAVGVGVDRGGTSVVEKSQVTQNTDANQTTPTESNTNVNPNQINVLAINSVQQRKLPDNATNMTAQTAFKPIVINWLPPGASWTTELDNISNGVCITSTVAASADNFISNTCSSAPTDPTTIAVSSTLDGVVVVTACTAAAGVDGIDEGGISVIENGQVTGSASFNTDQSKYYHEIHHY